MLSVQVDAERALAILEPQGALSKDDFVRAAKAIDPQKGHHRKIARVALCTDSALGVVAPKIGRHFVAAEIRAFKSSEFESAKSWAAGG